MTVGMSVKYIAHILGRADSATSTNATHSKSRQSAGVRLDEFVLADEDTVIDEGPGDSGSNGLLSCMAAESAEAEAGMFMHD